jgi:glycosyltransferase involved in cell wall biosynthesis
MFHGLMIKILQIGNYPPPVCGWAIQTKLLTEELRRRGIICEVMNLNENRRKKSREYIDVQSGFDYLYKLIRFAREGYQFQVHVNGQSRPGYILALLAAMVGRAAGRPVALSWRGGLDQKYFPRLERSWTWQAFRLLFRLAGEISCNDVAIKQAIERYGIEPKRVVAIPGFSVQHLDFQQAPLDRETEIFLAKRSPVFFCYVSFRPEYRLPTLREAMLRFQEYYSNAGFIWLGFPDRELPFAKEYVNNWPAHEREALLLHGNLPHDAFLTLLMRSAAYIRTPVCDGVSASVLESLALRTPVVASDNGNRPAGVITYRESESEDLSSKLVDMMARYREVLEQTRLDEAENNIVRTADWLLGKTNVNAVSSRSLAHAG